MGDENAFVRCLFRWLRLSKPPKNMKPRAMCRGFMPCGCFRTKMFLVNDYSTLIALKFVVPLGDVMYIRVSSVNAYS